MKMFVIIKTIENSHASCEGVFMVHSNARHTMERLSRMTVKEMTKDNKTKDVVCIKQENNINIYNERYELNVRFEIFEREIGEDIAAKAKPAKHNMFIRKYRK